MMKITKKTIALSITLAALMSCNKSRESNGSSNANSSLTSLEQGLSADPKYNFAPIDFNIIPASRTGFIAFHNELTNFVFDAINNGITDRSSLDRRFIDASNGINSYRLVGINYDIVSEVEQVGLDAQLPVARKADIKLDYATTEIILYSSSQEEGRHPISSFTEKQTVKRLFYIGYKIKFTLPAKAGSNHQDLVGHVHTQLGNYQIADVILKKSNIKNLPAYKIMDNINCRIEKVLDHKIFPKISSSIPSFKGICSVKQ